MSNVKQIEEIVTILNFSVRPPHHNKTIDDMRNSLIESGRQAIAVLESEREFQLGDKFGWLHIQYDNKVGKSYLTLKPGYGSNRQWVRHKDALVPEKKVAWLELDDRETALAGARELLSWAERGDFDDGLRELREKYSHRWKKAA